MDSVFAILLYLAETYGIMVYLLGMFVNAWPITRKSPGLPESPKDLPTIDVYIPTYNEPEDVVKITTIACTQMFYPSDRLNIYILDDGGTVQKCSDPDPEKAARAIRRAENLKTLAGELGIIYVTRDENRHAKAGNINNGIKQGCGELILILDCDHVPARNFLEKTIGFFNQDPKLFLLQTPHFFINPNPVEKNLGIFRQGPSENEMFYGAIHPGLDFWNASFFCGSAAVIRRKCLMEVGGIAGDTITEDAETALELHARGYNSAYLNEPLIIGLTPETFDDFILQRSRWAQGMIQIFILKNPLFQKGLSVFQKICYFNSSFFWFFSIARVIFFFSPLVLLFFGLRIYNASLAQVFAYAGPHLMAVYFLSNHLFGKFRHPFFSELYETIQSIYLLPAIISTIANPRSPVFKVTPKAVPLHEDFLSHLAMPFYLMLFISLLAYLAGIYKWVTVPSMADSIVLCMAWNTFNIIILLSCLGVVWEKRQTRRMHRYPTNEVVELGIPGNETITAKIIDLSISGAGILVEASERNLISGNITLHTTDSYGKRFVLQAKVVNSRQKGQYTLLGCEFQSNDPEMRTEIINFVYGDSSRWQLKGQGRLAKPVSNIVGLYRILRIGIHGSVFNFKGVWHILTRKLFIIFSGMTTSLIQGKRKKS
jgi:cellulose synthase (UDP-forming)